MKRLFLILVLTTLAVFGIAMYDYHESPGQVLDHIVRYVEGIFHLEPPPEPKKILPAPGVTPTPTPEPTPAATPTPEPTATPTPTPETTPDAIGWLLVNKKYWPTATRLTREVEFPLLLNGKEIGKVKTPAGTVVKVVAIERESLVVSSGTSTTHVPLSATEINLLSLADLEMKRAQALSAATPPPDPAKTFSKARSIEITDQLSPGNEASEKSHGLTFAESEIHKGGLDEPCRVLLPGGEAWKGGSLRFTMKVNPHEQNYFTVRLWGGDTSPNYLILICEGKQVGYRHLGDVDVLDIGDPEPATPGRFYYRTTPLPLALTKGKNELDFEIHSAGPIWGYGGTIEKLQQPMNQPTRGIYRLYTHTDPCFIPPATDKQGAAPKPKKRIEPNREILKVAQERVNNSLDGLLARPGPVNQMQAMFLAQAWHVPSSPAHSNKVAVDHVVDCVDELCRAYQANQDAVLNDSSTWNPGWFGVGPAAEAVHLLAKQIEPVLDKEITVGTKTTRREAWSHLFQESRDWLRHHRRLFTNQTMIVDLNLYRSNKVLADIDPKNALPESEAVEYLYEAVGLKPWLGSDTESGRAKPMGDDYWQLTKRGLTRELGYVGYYGEVLDWVTQIYNATRNPGEEGDPQIKERLEKIEQARSYFRYPAQDAEGNRAMRMETVIGWRDNHFPGDVTYEERPNRDGSAFLAATATLDPHSIGFAQQMLEDNQFFASVAHQMKETGLRPDMGLLGIAEQFETMKKQLDSKERFPMLAEQPDFVFSDEEDGVVALKNGAEILYVSLYWRSAQAVNSLARVHLIRPDFERIAVACEKTKLVESGQFFTRPDDITIIGANWVPRIPANLHSANEGERLPIAITPSDVTFKPGENNPYAGKAAFYELQFGDYLIGMNMSEKSTHTLNIPEGFRMSTNLATRQKIAGDSLKVEPRTTVVLHRD